MNYDGKIFKSVGNSEGGDVGPETVFHYHQDGNIVWAEYSGGSVLRGHLIAICDADGVLDMRYQHVNSSVELMTGECRSTPQILSDGRIRFHEKWKWTCGDHSTGESVIEEVS